MLGHRKDGPFTIEPVLIGSVAAYYMVVNAAGMPVAQGSLSLCRRTLGLPDAAPDPRPSAPPAPAAQPASAAPTPRQASLF